MPDTFVHFKCIKNNASRDDSEPEFWSHKFVCRHDTQEQFVERFNRAMNEVLAMQGVLIVKDVNKPVDQDNLMFIPMHMIARIEYETKRLSEPYKVDPDTEVKQ